ncbi:hypothetical protein [Asanoa sp. NPDC050611]|uniref:hypothetical protein n=1 Tax=Asanoa sp. NPDC050611 TaxID=3157098 RepID=UPI00340341B3
MKPGGSTALAMGVGYVLGRRHKLRAALMLGAAAAGGRMAARGQGGNGQGGQGQGGDGAAKPPSRGVVGKLGSAGKTAAITIVTRSADRIGERLTERAAAMRGSGGSGDSGGDDK